MKKRSLVPVIALSALLLAGCPKNQTTGNALVDALAKIQTGAVKKKVVDKLFKVDTISANDSKITKAKYEEDLFSPYGAYYDTLDEEFYEENVKRSQHITTFERYDNEMIYLTDFSEVYPFDRSTITEDNDDGIAKNPVTITGEAYVYHDEEGETLNYKYIRNGEKTDKYSFHNEIEYDEDLFEDASHRGGLGIYISQAKEDVEDTFNYYAANIVGFDKEETFVATKHEDGSFSVTFRGDLCMPLYSAELVWAWDHGLDEEGEEDYNQPIGTKKTNRWDNVYVDRRLRMEYKFEINKDAIVTSGEATYFCYHTSIMLDTAPEEERYSLISEDYPLTYPLTKEATRKLKERCIVPEVIEYYDEDQNLVEWKNSYADKDYKYDDYLQYNIDYFEFSADKLGNFTGEIPTNEGLRRQRDQVDTGVKFWINAYELMLQDH